MPTREEIVKALRCEKCVENNCPYYCVRWRDCNYRKMTTDAADMIEQQAKEIEQLGAERDAAIADLYKAKSCNTCAKQYKDDCQLEECMEPCSAFAEGGVPYEWRGVKEEP